MTISTYNRRLSFQFKRAVVQHPMVHKPLTVALELEVTPRFVNYWKKKAEDPEFKSGSWGGTRRFAFSMEEAANAELFLWAILHAHPTYSVKEFRAALSNYHVDVSSSWINRCIKRWKFSFKMVNRKLKAKYSPQNIQYYMTYLIGISTIDFRVIKFLDESTFRTKDLYRKKGRSRKGRPLTIVEEDQLSESYSITLLTTLREPVLEPPFHIMDIRSGNPTNATGFLEIIEEGINDGILEAGDVLVLDNAAIHFAEEIAQDLTDLLNANNIEMKFLPTYSPELSPCELAFAQAKRYMTSRRGNSSFYLELIFALGQIGYQNMVNYYNKCLHFGV